MLQKKVKNLFKYFHTLALTEKHLRKTNTYQIRFNNFHFVLHQIHGFEPIFADFNDDFEKKTVLERKLTLFGGQKKSCYREFRARDRSQITFAIFPDF